MVRGSVFKKNTLSYKRNILVDVSLSLNNSFLIKRLGEFIFCLLTGFLLATLATISICYYSIFLGALFGGCLYVSYLLLNEIVIVCGELETKFRDNIKKRY